MGSPRRPESNGADGSRDHAGLYAAVGLLNGGVTHFDQSFAGTDSMNAYSLGGYRTHFGAPGWYLDAILQGTWYDARAISGRLPTLTTNGWGFASSLEAGYPIKFRAGWIVEPQVQIVYQTVSLGDGNDTAAIVQFRNIESVAARIGARFARSWSLDDGPQSRSITAWIRPSFWNEFRGNPQTLFSSVAGPVPFQSNISGGDGRRRRSRRRKSMGSVKVDELLDKIDAQASRAGDVLQSLRAMVKKQESEATNWIAPVWMAFGGRIDA